MNKQEESVKNTEERVTDTPSIKKKEGEKIYPFGPNFVMFVVFIIVASVELLLAAICAVALMWGPFCFFLAFALLIGARAIYIKLSGAIDPILAAEDGLHHKNDCIPYEDLRLSVRIMNGAIAHGAYILYGDGYQKNVKEILRSGFYVRMTKKNLKKSLALYPHKVLVISHKTGDLYPIHQLGGKAEIILAHNRQFEDI